MSGPPPGSDAHAARAFDTLLERGERVLLVLVDERMRILRASPGAAALAGRERESLAGLSLIAAFGSTGLDALARRVQASGQPGDGDVELSDRPPRSFFVSCLPLAGSGQLLVLSDETQLRRLARIRRDFVANIGHELRNPLASIKLISETLASGVDDPAAARDFALQIEREVDHLVQLVDELRDLSLIESGELTLAVEAVDPDELVRRTVERIGPMAERRDVRVRALDALGGSRPESPAVAADPARIGQALLNLAHNAVKFSHPGGEVRIGWQPVGATRVRLTVADDGIGIPAAHADRVFERFYKIDRARARSAEDPELGASAGLGLAIVRHIAEAHAGTVGVTSQEGVGSTFWIELPVAD